MERLVSGSVQCYNEKTVPRAYPRPVRRQSVMNKSRESGYLPGAPTAATIAAVFSERLDENTADRLLSEALSRGGDFAEVYAERNESTHLPLEENKIQGAEVRQSLGVGIRVIHGEKQGYAYSDDLSLERLLEAARVAAYIAEGGKPLAPVPVSRQPGP